MARLTLLTLNCFGVPTPSTRTRLATLARLLDEECPDVACLQEVQLNRYLRLLQRSVRGLRHRAHEPFLHAPKGGLLTLSQHAIHSAQFTLYRHRGWWHTPSLTDWLLHKGVLVTALAIDDRPVRVVNTHLLANYDGDWSAENRYAQAEQAELEQLAQIVNALPAEALVVVAGDFNVPRGSWLYEEFRRATGAQDPLAADAAPTYRPLNGLPARYAQAIDHVLVRPPRDVPVRATARRRFEERVTLTNGRPGFLSDHLGIEAQIEW